MKKSLLLLLASCSLLVINAQVPMMRGANDPVGTPQGINAGRVAWTHAPGANTWDGKGQWYNERWVNQDDADWLVAQALVSLTGQKNEAKAWKALFVWFNQQHGKGKRGYQAGEKIGIKVNMNNTYSHAESGEINATPHMVLALLRSLVNAGGVNQSCITVFDASRLLTDGVYQKCVKEFPKVRYVDNVGGEGRIKSEYVKDAIRYSKESGNMCKDLCTVCTESDYLINMALLKGHVSQGVTLCGKNWYGVTAIDKDWRKNAHVNMSQNMQGKPCYLTYVDYMGHKDIGGKTMLYLVDGMFACKYVNGAPGPKWQMAPFNHDWPCSLLMSQDPVAIDAVALDFLVSEFPDAPDMPYADAYMVEAALAHQAPSGTVYDPEGDGSPLKSLGVAEHWNNAVDKHYTRIDLVYKKR